MCCDRHLEIPGVSNNTTRLLFDIIDNAEEQNEYGMIFFTDFEKAFDSLDHQYMFKFWNILTLGTTF